MSVEHNRHWYMHYVAYSNEDRAFDNRRLVEPRSRQESEARSAEHSNEDHPLAVTASLTSFHQITIVLSVYSG